MNTDLVRSKAPSSTLEEWIIAYGDAILRTCFLYLSDRALAEDATQDTFIKAWRSMEKFEGRSGCSEKTWILRIAINTCKDYKRSAWFRHINLSKALKDLPILSPDISDESRGIFLDVMSLPSKYKQVILLYYFHDMTMAEAAQVLHVSRSTVQYRLEKAHALLRFRLGKDD